MYHQTNVGRFVTAYQKETGEVVIRFERAQYLFHPAEWAEVLKDLGIGETRVAKSPTTR